MAADLWIWMRTPGLFFLYCWRFLHSGCFNFQQINCVTWHSWTRDESARSKTSSRILIKSRVEFSYPHKMYINYLFFENERTFKSCYASADSSRLFPFSIQLIKCQFWLDLAEYSSLVQLVFVLFFCRRYFFWWIL